MRSDESSSIVSNYAQVICPTSA